jgi:hypothetical protein
MYLDAFGRFDTEEALADISALLALTHLCLESRRALGPQTYVLLKCLRLELLPFLSSGQL